jgi:hypothetical protein
MNKHTHTDPLAELAALRQRLDKLEAEHSDFQRNASRRPFVPRKFLLTALAVVLVFAGGLLGEENMPLFIDPTGNVRIGTLTCANIVQEGWQPVVFENGWHNLVEQSNDRFNDAGYFKDSVGIVHLKGTLGGGSNTVIFRLPYHYKPWAHEVFACLTKDNVIGRVDVRSSGEVMVTIGGNSGGVCLDGITFRAGH